MSAEVATAIHGSLVMLCALGGGLLGLSIFLGSMIAHRLGRIATALEQRP